MIKRRDFLKNAGILSFLSTFRNPSKLFAQTQTKKNIIFIFTPYGFRPNELGSLNKGNTLKFDAALSSLSGFEEKSNMIRNIKYGYEGVGDPHQQGCGKFLSGANLAPGTFGRGDDPNAKVVGFGGAETLDNILGRQLNPGGYRKSLYVALSENFEVHPYNVISLTKANQPHLPHTSSLNAFNWMFSGISRSENKALQIKKNQSLLDTLTEEIKSMQMNLPKELKVHLEENLQGLRQIERSILASNIECAPPSISNIAQNDINNWDKLVDDYIEILARSIACDLTRVGVLQFFGCLSYAVMAILGMTQNGHQVSHDSSAKGKRDSYTYIQYFAAKIRKLLDTLDSIKDGNNDSLLDNTLVVWGSESTWLERNGGIHGHSLNNMQYFTFGGSNFIKTKNLVDLEQRKFNNDFLITISNSMGINIPQIGEQSKNSGPIDQLLR